VSRIVVGEPRTQLVAKRELGIIEGHVHLLSSVTARILDGWRIVTTGVQTRSGNRTWLPTNET
jgi:hypothetical protein